MRIGIDIRKYSDFGIGTYIQNLLVEFHKQSAHEYVYFAADEQRALLQRSFSGSFVLENSPKYSLKELYSLSQKANAEHLNVLHVPHYTLPVRLRMPSVVTIHDIIHLRLKEYFSVAQRSYAYLMLKHACHASSAIIVDSEFTKRDLLERFRVDENKIHAIHLGVNPLFFQKVGDEKKEALKQKYNISKSYILYTGSLKPHKNIPVLIKAFEKVNKKKDLQLVFTGENLNDYPHLLQLITQKNVNDSVRNLVRINADELVTAYHTASAVVLPSLYEGFGFSMVEAMASGVPAIGARATSIPEVVGDGGMLFTPNDENELAEILERVLQNPTERNSLIQKGYERAKKFSWKQCADETLHVYEKVAI